MKVNPTSELRRAVNSAVKRQRVILETLPQEDLKERSIGNVRFIRFHEPRTSREAKPFSLSYARVEGWAIINEQGDVVERFTENCR